MVHEIIIIFDSKPLKPFVLRKTPLRKQKAKPQPGRKHLQILYLTEDLHPEYIKNLCNSIIRQKQFLKLGKLFK